MSTQKYEVRHSPSDRLIKSFDELDGISGAKMFAEAMAMRDKTDLKVVESGKQFAIVAAYNYAEVDT